MLVVGAAWIVTGAVAFATSLGVPEIIVGLTIVAVGHPCPRSQRPVLAGIRGHRDIAVGNVVGSCIFNILMVLGAVAVVSPEPVVVSPALLTVDLPLMVAAAVGRLPILYTGQVVSRREGVLMLGIYVAYLAYLVLLAGESPSAGVRPAADARRRPAEGSSCSRWPCGSVPRSGLRQVRRSRQGCPERAGPGPDGRPASRGHGARARPRAGHAQRARRLRDRCPRPRSDGLTAMPPNTVEQDPGIVGG